MATLIAEDLLLLLLDDAKGTPPSMANLPAVLGGAVLVELALSGAVTVEEKRGMWHTPRVQVAPDARVDDPMLAAGLATVAEKPRSAQDLVNRLGKGAREQLAARLVERGILERHEGRVLGLFPRTTWPAVDSRHEEEVRQRLTAVLVQGLEPDPRTGALVALLQAVSMASKVVDRQGLPAGEVRKRAKTIAEGQWAPAAVKSAVDATNAAMLAAVAAAGAAAGSGS